MSTVDVVFRDVLAVPMRGHAVDETEDLTPPLGLDRLVLTFYFSDQLPGRGGEMFHSGT